MARGKGIFGRITDWFRGTPEPKREPSPGWFKESETAQAAPQQTGKLKYHPDSDSWTGRDSDFMNQSLWDDIKDRAETNITDYDRVYHESLIKGLPRVQRGTYTHKIGNTFIRDIPADVLGYTSPEQRYADLIKALESGNMSPSRLLQTLQRQADSTRAFVNSNPTPGRAAWNSAADGVPDSIYYYH